MAFSRETPSDFRGALKMVRELLSARKELVERGSVETEAEQIVIGAYRVAEGEEISRTELHVRLREHYPELAAEKAMVMAMARAEGKLLQHLLGYQAFLSHDYLVSPSVLVPRPETEVLATVAIEDLEARGAEPALGLEVGLGSGVLSVELLHRFQALLMIASELSKPAIATATRNASRILGVAGASRLHSVLTEDASQVLEPLERALGEGRADFLISNPPYLSRDAGVSSEREVDEEVDRFEPHAALYAPSSDLLHFYRRIAEGAARLLKPGAPAYLELPHERASRIVALFEESGWKTKLLKDLAGRERVLVAEGKS